MVPGPSSQCRREWAFEAMGKDGTVQGECLERETGGLRVVL